MELLSILALLLSSSVLTAVVSSWFNRRKVNAEANSVIVDTALEVVKNTVAPLNNRIDQMEVAIENLNAEILKVQLVVVILQTQIEALGHEPMVNLSDLSCISVEELRQIAREIKEKK